MEANAVTKVLLWVVGGMSVMVAGIFRYIVKRGDDRYESMQEMYHRLDKEVRQTDARVGVLENELKHASEDIKAINSRVESIDKKIDDLPLKIIGHLNERK